MCSRSHISVSHINSSWDAQIAHSSFVVHLSSSSHTRRVSSRLVSLFKRAVLFRRSISVGALLLLDLPTPLVARRTRTCLRGVVWHIRLSQR